jgi:hypothetical protein
VSNSILTPTAVTREALRILHEKATFIGSINKQYDNQFAKTGAKIGDSLKIRLPNEYTVRTGRAISVQDTQEQSVTLTVATQKGVDMAFTSSDLTLSLDDFSKRILEPAMAVLAANIEADALSMRNDIYNIYDDDGNALDIDSILGAGAILDNNLVPRDSNRHALLGPKRAAYLVSSLKGLFQDSQSIAKQYREGMMGRGLGFDFAQSSLATQHTTGTAAKTTSYVVNTSTGITSGSGTVTVSGGTATFLVGDIVTIQGVNRVHPESKEDTGELQTFVVTENSGASATSLKVSPAPVTSGARQNVVINSAGASKAVVKVGAGNGETYTGDIVYHRDAFTFATADLIMPKGVDFSAREVMDGISMRIVRQYDINNDNLPCRIDVLYGYKTIRAQMACRVQADGTPS